MKPITTFLVLLSLKAEVNFLFRRWGNIPFDALRKQVTAFYCSAFNGTL
jgi:hypothetical protein